MVQDFPKFELEQVLRGDAADILAAREKARIIHHGKDIKTAGDEVEITFRKVLRRKLPSSYFIGHGHIVDENLHTSPQFDTIIADNAGTATLLQAENGTEYFPYEGIYAIGEVKSSYENSKRHIHTFADTLVSIHSQLHREVAMPEPPPYQQPYSNPLFSFMFFADAGDFRIEQVLDLYKTRPASDLPNIVCILNKGVIVNTVNHVEENEQQNWEPLKEVKPGMISLIPAYNGNYQMRGLQFHWVLMKQRDNDNSLAANFATFYYTLTQHLQNCQLTPPNLVKYLKSLFNAQTSTVIS